MSSRGLTMPGCVKSSGEGGGEKAALVVGRGGQKLSIFAGYIWERKHGGIVGWWRRVSNTYIYSVLVVSGACVNAHRKTLCTKVGSFLYVLLR